MPSAVEAQQTTKTARVGVLASAPRQGSQNVYPNLVARLGEMGYIEGQNLVIEARHPAAGPPGTTGYAPLASELVALNVDVIFATDPYALRAAREATTTIPIVAYDLESDPVASGFAASLARPGANVTGIFLDQPEVSAKQLQLLKDAVPRLTRVVVLWDSALAEAQFKSVEEGARRLGVTVHSIVWRGPGEVAAAFRKATRDGAQGLIVLSSPALNASQHRRAIVEATLSARLPSINLFPDFAKEGGFMAYGPHRGENYRAAATLVAKILGGARSAELPIERPGKFELWINVKTAKTFGLTVPQTLLLQADQLIE